MVKIIYKKTAVFSHFHFQKFHSNVKNI